MKQAFIILLVIICFAGCNNDEFSNDVSSFNSLKVYDFDVQRVKKIHNLFALINTKEILFLDENGNRAFDFSYNAYNDSVTKTFKLTDVVAGANNDIFILCTEILKDYTFKSYVFKIADNGQSLWENPVVIPISNDYNYNYKLSDLPYFFISENGYALGCFNNNTLYLVINGQTAIRNSHWYYKLIALNDAGSVIMQSDTIQEEDHPEIWNFMLEPLPNGNLITSLKVGYNGAYFHQFDSNNFELLKTSKILKYKNSSLPIFTNMLLLNSSEVIFTGHIDMNNNSINGANYDAFLVKYNTVTDKITDTLNFGANASFELAFHSFLDVDGNVKCIGTKREDLFLSQGANSNLYEISFDLNNNSHDSLFIIKDKGYEGLYFEPIGNSGILKIIGSKLDISGRQNKQAFFTIVKP